MAVAAAMAVAVEVVAGMEAALAGMEAADAEASALEAAEVAEVAEVAEAAEAAAAAADPAGYGHHSAWSTAAGVSLPLQLRYPLSRRSSRHRRRRFR
jgi:hypothetical protein